MADASKMTAVPQRRCGTCRFWFDYQTPAPPYRSPYKPCNHPSAGGHGLAPLKTATDGCGKHEPRSLLRPAETVKLPGKTTPHRGVKPDAFT